MPQQTAIRPRADIPESSGCGSRYGNPLLLGVVAVMLVVSGFLAVVHLGQGTASVTGADLWALLTGGGTEEATAVVAASRVPRLAAGILVGAALGAAGAVMQSVSRNILASPDTLAVNAGAHLAVVVVAAFGLPLPIFGAVGVAFTGGLAAAALVLVLSGAPPGSWESRCPEPEPS